MKLIIKGSHQNNRTIDGSGSILYDEKDALLIHSSYSNGYGWFTPNNVIIKNYIISGSVRIYGLGKNGESEPVRLSSYDINHTSNAQAAAPSNITLDNVQIHGSGRIPFYVSPGCTNITLKNSTINGRSSATAIYLDAESANNKIVNNLIDLKTKREFIAVDGSANNLISGNTFINPGRGGIYLYRNPGEGGTVRHQTPSNNIIEHNSFQYKHNHIFAKLIRWFFPTIWIGSRSGIMNLFRFWYRNADKGYPFGSSVENNDLAENNIIRYNIPDKQIIIRNYYDFIKQ